jgi:hypothetical protein
MLGRSTRPRIPALLVLCALAAGTAWAQTPSAGPAAHTHNVDVNEQSRKALIASGEAPDLFLLYTGDVIGYVDPCG